MIRSFTLRVTQYVFLFFLAGLISASVTFPGTKPVLNTGKKWRIGYYEGGPYISYPRVLKKLVQGLVELGWMDSVSFPEFDESTDSKKLWDFLAQNVPSQYIEFVQDAYWSAEWSNDQRSRESKEIIQRLNIQRDIDFMIAAGTWAGQDLANNTHSTPTMAISVSDPLRAGISTDAAHSGFKHFFVKCDPDRYVRQIRLFHRLVKFKKLGVVFENTVEGRSYAAFDEIVKSSRERNFALVTCEVPTHEYDLSQTTDDIIQCHERLSREADAVFVTTHRGLDHSRMEDLVAPFLANKTPTWSQQGPDEVRMGLLFSTTKKDFSALGRFLAEVMARTFNGEDIGSIDQTFSDPEFIAVNKKVAEMIGYDIPFSILKIADEVYDRIDHE